MEYVLNSKQIDKLLKPFWDEHFDGTTVGNIKNSYGNDWSGVIKDTDEGPILLIGHPVGKEDIKWYSNGKYFQGKWGLFSMTPSDFNDAMARYVNTTYGLNVTDII
jgi:hypothetical protein